MLVLLFDIMGFGIVGGYLSKLCVTLPHMSICAGVVIPITFQKVDDTPYAKARPDCYDQGLQSSNCTGKKCHINHQN